MELKTTSKTEVEKFLLKLNQKIKIFDIVFRDDRGKNFQTLIDLEITPKYRKDIILNLKSEDYISGPLIDTLNKMGEMWVFGKDIKGHDIYIKISLGQPSKEVICISFHIAERPLEYKFK